MSKIQMFKEWQKKVELVESYIEKANSSHWDKFNFRIIQAETRQGTYGDSGTSSWDSEIVNGLINLLSGRQKESLVKLKSLWTTEMEKARQEAKEEALSVLGEVSSTRD